MKVSLKNAYFRVGLELTIAWLFVAFSYYVSQLAATDWFSRSGAVMCLLAAGANFGLVKLHQRDLARIFRDQEHSPREKAQAILRPPKTFARLSRLSYLTGIFGTAIWGYGDLLL